MGIKGLTKFIRVRPRDHNEIYTRREIQGNLVIDGSQFCHYYYNHLKLDRINGGQYPEFRQEVTEFFCKLRRCRIKSHVVFEGVDKGQKLTDDYIMEKARSKYELPQLVYTVVYNVLVCMGIPMYVGDGEGDETCVQIANFLNCPVLSNDSDFYLFNIRQGYIELDHVKFELQQSLHDGLSVDVYYREDFMRCFFRENSDRLYLIPVIMKDKAIVQHITSQLGRRGNVHDSDIELVYSYLQSVSSIHDETGNMALTQSFESTRAYYNNPACQNPDELPSKPINFDLPGWLLREHRNHNMPYMLVDALVNKKQHSSNSPVSKYIRQCCYSILGVPEVKEYCIEDNQAVTRMVRCADSLQPCYSISELLEVSERERTSFLFSIFHCFQDQLAWVEDKEKLLVCSVAFWMTQTRPPIYVVKALLACFVLLSSCSDENVHYVRNNVCCNIPGEYRRSENWLRDRQLFLDWQCVYKDGIALRSLLQCPPVEICPSKIYDGNIVMSLASQLDRIDNVIQRLEILMEKYYNFLQIVTSK